MTKTAGLATNYHQLGMLAQARGDYDEAFRQYERSMVIKDRLGDMGGLATTFSQVGDLEKDRGGPAIKAIGWHVGALTIRLRIDVPEAVIDLRALAEWRRVLGAGPFGGLLEQASGNAELAEEIVHLLDRVDDAGRSP